jgi:hypothetical protein
MFVLLAQNSSSLFEHRILFFGLLVGVSLHDVASALAVALRPTVAAATTATTEQCMQPDKERN